MASGGPADPASWNRYTYTRGDPINRFDPSGLQDEGPPELPFFGYCPDGTITFYGGTPCPLPTPGNLWGWNIPDVSYIYLYGFSWLLPKQIANGTDDQAKIIRKAYIDALLRLLNIPACHDALTTSDHDATATLEDTVYRVLDLGNTHTGAQTVTSSSVFINSTGAFFATPDAEGHVTVTIPSATPGGPSTQITFLSQASVDAFILLHEVGHQTGLFGEDAGDSLEQVNAQHSWLVLTNCFGITQPGGH